jgi:hypothetical protein
MTVSKCLLSIPGQLSGRRNSISNLSTIQLGCSKCIDIAEDILCINFKATSVASNAVQARYEVSPNYQSLVSVQVLVAKVELDARFERLIEYSDTIACQYQDA